MNNSVDFIEKDELNRIKSAVSKNAFVAEINGEEIQSWTDYWNAVSSSFSFPVLPSYLKPDYHTYYDLMTDLSWVKEDSIILIVANANVFLKEDLQLKNTIIKDFQEYLLPFWDSEVVDTVVGGKKRNFSVYFVKED